MRRFLSRPSSLLPLLLFPFLLFPLAAPAQPPAVMNAAETQLALKRLAFMGSALYVAAHPDDENTAMLAYLANGVGARTAYLSVTRGDGGQNLIGDEKGERLGLLRTHELLAARRVDGAEQFFTRAVDFGYTKTPDEALRFWGRDAVLADVVWVIRRFRPDVVITRFPATGEGGHGQHTASALLAREAFEAAGDPARFPEQLAHVRAWRPKRLLWNVFRFQPGAKLPEGGKLMSVDLGAYNPLLGRSYTEVAAQSRTMHKSQGFGSAERRGTAVNYLAHLAGDEADSGLFDGVEVSWRRVPGGEAVGKILEEAARDFRPSAPEAILPQLLRAHREMSKLSNDDALVEAKRRELLDVIRAAAGLWVEAVAAAPHVTPGEEARVSVTVVNRSNFPLRIESIRPPHGQPMAVNTELRNNQPHVTELRIAVPRDAEYDQPYWLREEPGLGLFKVGEQTLVGRPENPPSLPVEITLAAEGERFVLEVPALFRWTDRVQGELYRPVEVVPRVAVQVEESVVVFPDAAPKQVRVKLRNNSASPVSGTLTVRVPEGWRATPESIPVSLKERGEEFGAAFSVAPPAGAASAKTHGHSSVGTLSAEFLSDNSRFTRGLVEIDYGHVPRRTLFPPAEARLVRVNVEKRGRLVGYVMGPGDEVPEALRQVGYQVALLSDEELEKGDLGRYDAVVTGVRAYNTRASLRRQQKRLLEYVERGGTLVVQYNTTDQSLAGVQLGPYPFKLSQERVTAEDAPVRILAPQDAAITGPNRITAADFDGWVQERGLYFPNEWDQRYQPLFETGDPGEPGRRGGTLLARHGKGVYVYTAYSWFRQLPAGVPGAYRVFVNLVSTGKS